MPHISAVDDLAEVRLEIARLRLREADLRARLMSAPAGSLLGRWSRAEVSKHTRKVLNLSLLPDQIRDDPTFWHLRETTIVRCVGLLPASPRPGWPIRITKAAPATCDLH